MVFNILGGSIQDAFQAVADAKDGQYSAGLLGSNPRVRIPFHDWCIELDHYNVSSGNSSATHTRVFAAFVNDAELHFTVTRAARFFKTFFNFFQPPVVIDLPSDLGPGCEVRGRPPEVLKDIFDNETLRRAVDGFSNYSISTDRGVKLFELSTAKRRYRHDTLKFEFSYLEKDAQTLVTVVELIEVLLLCLWRQSAGSEPSRLMPAERPQLERITNALDANLAWLSALVEPTPEGKRIRLRSPLHGVEANATLLLHAPLIPYFTTPLRFTGALNGGGPTGTFHTPNSLMDKMANFTDTKLGDATVDDAFVIGGPAADKEALQKLIPALTPIAALPNVQFQIRIQPDSLDVQVENCDQDQTEMVVELLVALWKRTLEQALGTASVLTP